jgi:hypothetical protein
MIHFIHVVGDVRVDDKKGQRTLAPSSGMTMRFKGADCLIATGNSGRATITVQGNQVVLKEKSFLRIRPDGRSFAQKHWENFKGDWRLFFGRLWAIAMRKVGTERREVTGSGGGGIRG